MCIISKKNYNLKAQCLTVGDDGSAVTLPPTPAAHTEEEPSPQTYPVSTALCIALISSEERCIAAFSVKANLPGSRVSPCPSSSPCPGLYTCVPIQWIFLLPTLTVVSIRTAFSSSHDAASVLGLGLAAACTVVAHAEVMTHLVCDGGSYTHS
ncbi:hypothetical protein F7725_009868 [Dissostichus mawsoni]|uniref:Uncharacterized protein n=1 Tax=Dissostichus mawsoni TaxID=36200 RepID=A0A7J5XM80_DISMA|nr:hypothetical protein F7725_009868 [Dissostichus mawsoni]